VFGYAEKSDSAEAWGRLGGCLRILFVNLKSALQCCNPSCNIFVSLACRECNLTAQSGLGRAKPHAETAAGKRKKIYRGEMKRFLCIAIFAVLAILPASPSGAASTDDHSYRWQTVPFGGGGYVPGYLYHPTAGNLLYARTDVGGLYRFDFANRKWIQLLGNLGRDDGDLAGVLSIALDPGDPAKVYTANGLYLGEWARKGAILRSNDRGATWQKTELPIRVGGNSDGRGSGERLVVDPANGRKLYYASNQDGLWLSDDGAVSFSKISSPSSSYSLVAIDPKSGDVYLGSADGRGALYISRDHGRNFARVSQTPEQVPQHMAFGKDGSVYVAFSGADSKNAISPAYADRGSVWKRDAAGNWTDITPERPTDKLHFGYSGVDVGPDGTVAVAILDRWDGGNGIYLSRDGGAHWLGLKGQTHHNLDSTPWLKSQIGDPEQIGGWLSDVKINPFNRNEMIFTGTWFSHNLSDAGTGKKVEIDLETTDLEETCTTQLVAPMSGPVKVMASMLDNAGAAWYDITKGPDAGVFRPAKQGGTSVDYAALRPLFIVREADEASTKGYYSMDGAKTWTPFPSTPYKTAPDEWHSPGVVAVSAGGTSIVWVPEKQSAYFSTDKGRTWKESAGWPARRDRQLTVISDKAYDGAFYAYDLDGTILMSVDGGASFHPIVTGLKKIESWQRAELHVVPGRLRDLWLVAPYGLLHSADAQMPMTDLPHVTDAWALGFGAPLVQGGYPAVYLWGRVNKQEGLWRSDDEGLSWVRINDAAHWFGGIDHIAGDWREPGVVYIAPGARGLMVGRPAD
jgi:photosystem II stability/assembly factor-like uncharacterized protein